MVKLNHIDALISFETRYVLATSSPACTVKKKSNLESSTHLDPNLFPETTGVSSSVIFFDQHLVKIDVNDYAD